MIHICVPVLKRYDLLREMLLSLDKGTVRPDMVHIVNNGRDRDRLTMAMVGFPLDVMTPDHPIGLAEAWNWFIDNVPEERLICNDDLLFAPHSLEMLLEAKGSFVSGLAGSNACSCFLLRDACIVKVGKFDEDISPGYAYFEDCDYIERMIMQGIPITGVNCGVSHVGSATTAKNSQDEWNEHHRRFMIAQNNFVTKWGRLPNVPGPHWPKVEA